MDSTPEARFGSRRGIAQSRSKPETGKRAGTRDERRRSWANSWHAVASGIHGGEIIVSGQLAYRKRKFFAWSGLGLNAFFHQARRGKAAKRWERGFEPGGFQATR